MDDCQTIPPCCVRAFPPTVSVAWTEANAILYLKSGFLDPYNLINKFFYKISNTLLESL